MTYIFSKSSKDRLNKVDYRLKMIANNIIEITRVDFTITSGLRTKEEQEELVKNGKSWNLQSKHLEGKAIDICPYINGLDFNATDDLFYLIGMFDCEAHNLGIKIRLGAFWDGNSIKENKKLDGFHIELVD